MKDPARALVTALLLLATGWFLYATVQQYLRDARNAQG